MAVREVGAPGRGGRWRLDVVLEGWMEVVGWEGGREEGGGAPGEGDICSPCIFHKGEMERWERAWKESDGQARLCAGLGRGEAAAEAAGPTAQLSMVWVRVQGRLRARALLAHTRVSACKQPAACITRPWVCTWGR